jgi:hypothetical protein
MDEDVRQVQVGVEHARGVQRADGASGRRREHWRARASGAPRSASTSVRAAATSAVTTAPR